MIVFLNLVFWFQFLKGAIKSHKTDTVTITLHEFQFLKGAIKSAAERTKNIDFYGVSIP